MKLKSIKKKNSKPRVRICYRCGCKLRGNHHAEVRYEGIDHTFIMHKECADIEKLGIDFPVVELFQQKAGEKKPLNNNITQEVRNILTSLNRRRSLCKITKHTKKKLYSHQIKFAQSLTLECPNLDQ